MKFRKKPVEIEAVRWTGENFDEIAELAIANPKCYAALDNLGWLKVGTMEGELSDPVPVGHWIIQGVQGEVYPCSPDVFEATYEPAE